MPETRSPDAELPRVIGELGNELELAYARADRSERLATTPPAGPRRSRRRGFAIAVAVAVVAVAVVALAGVRVGDKRAGVSDALGDVAQRIEVAPQPKPGQFLYTRSSATRTGLERAGLDYKGNPHPQFVVTRPHFESSWLSVTRNGRLLMQGGRPTFPTAKDAEIGRRFYATLDWFERAQRNPRTRHATSKIWWKLAHWNEARGMGPSVGFPESPEAQRGTMISNDRLSLGGEMLTEKQVKAYPRDPSEIYARVRREFTKQDRQNTKLQAKFEAKLPADLRVQKGENPDVDESVWGALSQSNGQLPAAQELRSAVVRALAYLPGVKSEGTTSDARGRSGELFTWDHEGKRFSVVFDEKTSVVLSSQTVVVDPQALAFVALRHLPAGTKLATYELIEQKTIVRLPKRR